MGFQGQLYRRMQEHNPSVRKCYSDIPDNVLDQKVKFTKARMPHAGSRLVTGSLQVMGHRISWRKVKMSLQRVNGTGIISRMVQLSCIARRTYSVPAPLSLVHIDTNHKLIRCYFSFWTISNHCWFYVTQSYYQCCLTINFLFGTTLWFLEQFMAFYGK